VKLVWDAVVPNFKYNLALLSLTIVAPNREPFAASIVALEPELATLVRTAVPAGGNRKCEVAIPWDTTPQQPSEPILGT